MIALDADMAHAFNSQSFLHSGTPVLLRLIGISFFRAVTTDILAIKEGAFHYGCIRGHHGVCVCIFTANGFPRTGFTCHSTLVFYGIEEESSPQRCH